jgi:hypothetical protein
VGVLTETAMRLRDQIVASRHARVALRADLVRQTDERRTRVSALCAGFASDRAGAGRAWFGPTPGERRAAERQQQREAAENLRAKAREKQGRPAEETAKPQAEMRPPLPPKGEPHRHEAAKVFTAPHARPLAAPPPRVHKPPVKGSKKH